MRHLTPQQLEMLRDIGDGTSRADDDCDALVQHGLVVTGISRFGTWAKLTEAGRQYLAGMASQPGGRAARRQVCPPPDPKAGISFEP